MSPATRPLRIGLNLVYLEERSGGAGTYARELIGALLEAEPGIRIVAFVSSEAPGWLDAAPWRPEIEVVRYPVTITHGPRGNFVRVMGAQWALLPWQAARRRLDVVHGLANITPLVAPRVATVVTVLDLIWMRFAHTLERSATVGMRLTTPPSARRADRVIAISHAAKADLSATLGLPAGKIDVTHLGMRPGDPKAPPTSETELRARLGLGNAPVVLTVGQKREHKNQLGLIRALPCLDGAVLVLPGAPTPHEAVLRAEAARLDLDDRVVFPDWLSPADLEGLYRLAHCFALPSFEEGFGLPILEAMGRGVPVACSNASSLPEVAGDAAELFDPAEPEDIARALRAVLGDERRRAELRRRGLERAGQFPWRRTAEATLDSYRRAIAARRGA